MITRRSFSLLAASPQFGKIFERLGGRSGLPDGRIGEGLKEALRIGTGNAVNLTGRKDGFLLNPAIRILLPEPLQKVERGLRMAGFGGSLDELALGMNRAAEAATPLAKEIFLGALREMTFADAKAILRGSDTAATEYFQDKTTPKLTELFRPPVTKVMGELGVTKQWNALLAQMRRVPFLRVDAIDLDGYVVSKSLSGLFHVLGQEETKIRKDPAARVTALLKEVFSGR